MKRFNSIGIATGLLLTFGLLAPAQFAPRAQYDPATVNSLVDRVHLDLNRAYGAYRFTHDDRDRLNHAEKELREFSTKWDRGNFDKGELNDAISSVQHVLDNNNLPVADRDALSQDVSQMRRMREAYNHHEIQGANH